LFLKLAIGWCPFKSNVLATGGGRADKKLKLWNIYNGNCLNTVDTESQISAIFWSDYYKEIIITHEYSSFIIFKNNYPNVKQTYLLSKFFNKTIYDYLKYNLKLFKNDNINYKIGYWYLDKFFNETINNDIFENLPTELKIYQTNKELFINTIEKYFYYYDKVILLFNNPIFENEYIILTTNI
jgi:hypothetical protein